MLLSGRTAIVTGAGRGIGAAIARALDGAGARVALVARSLDELSETAAGLANDPVVVTADLGTGDGPAAAVAQAVDGLGGRLDVVVNNAGIALRKPSDELTADEVDLVWQVNVRSALLVTATAIPHLLASDHASVVSISSISGLRARPGAPCTPPARPLSTG